MDRRTLLTAMLSTAAASVWTPPDAFALGLPKDKIKRVRYYKTPTDAAGRPNIHQPTFNQSTNIVTIETEQTFLVRINEIQVIALGANGQTGTLVTVCQTIVVEIQQIIVVVQPAPGGGDDDDIKTVR